MAYTSGFFDAVDQGGGDYDRVYSAATFAHYFSLLVKNGVFPDPSTGMQVKASSSPDMHVSVQPGSGWVNGYYITVGDNAPEQLTIPTANPSLSRIDSVIMGLNYVDREIQLYIKSGAVSASPSAVSLQRDNDLYELELAQIAVGAGVASISQTSIADMRQNTSRCGIVAGTIDQIDTTNLFAQYDDAFKTWFNNIQAQLSGDVATNLQKQISSLKDEKLNVDSKASISEAELGIDNTKYMTPATTQSWADKNIIPTLNKVPSKADLSAVQKGFLNIALEGALEYGRLSYQTTQSNRERNVGYKQGSSLILSGNSLIVGSTASIGAAPYESSMSIQTQTSGSPYYFPRYSSLKNPPYLVRGVGFQTSAVGETIHVTGVEVSAIIESSMSSLNAFYVLDVAIVRIEESTGKILKILASQHKTNVTTVGVTAINKGSTTVPYDVSYTVTKDDSYVGIVVFGTSTFTSESNRSACLIVNGAGPSQGVFDSLLTTIVLATSNTYSIQNAFDLELFTKVDITKNLSNKAFPGIAFSISKGSISGSVFTTMPTLDDDCTVETVVVEASAACKPILLLNNRVVNSTLETEFGKSANNTDCVRSILKSTVKVNSGTNIMVTVESASELTIYDICTKAV